MLTTIIGLTCQAIGIAILLGVTFYRLDEVRLVFITLDRIL